MRTRRYRADDETGVDINANADGDCMTDVEEEALGTDPNQNDSDGDGVSDCDEIDAVSDPLDGEEVPRRLWLGS